MESAKCWQVSTALLESLIDAADLDGNCQIEVYSATSNVIDDCQLYIKLATAWQNAMPIIPPTIPPIV